MKNPNRKHNIETPLRRKVIVNFRAIKTGTVTIPLFGEIYVDRIHIISAIVNIQIFVDVFQDVAGSACYFQNPGLLWRFTILVDYRSPG